MVVQETLYGAVCGVDEQVEIEVAALSIIPLAVHHGYIHIERRQIKALIAQLQLHINILSKLQLHIAREPGHLHSHHRFVPPDQRGALRLPGQTAIHQNIKRDPLLI